MVFPEGKPRYKVGYICSTEKDGANRIGFFEFEIYTIEQYDCSQDERCKKTIIVTNSYFKGYRIIDFDKAVENTKIIAICTCSPLFNNFFITDDDFSEECLSRASYIKGVPREEIRLFK